MLRKLANLIAVAYWTTHNYCGGDFQVEECKGGDIGPCSNYDFCLNFTELLHDLSALEP